MTKLIFVSNRIALIYIYIYIYNNKYGVSNKMKEQFQNPIENSSNRDYI